VPASPVITLVAINARYSHTALGARFLLANMGALRHQTRFVEATINDPPEGILKQIEATNPAIIGIGVYIWNRALVDQLLPVLRARHPRAAIILGGPEISHDTDAETARSATCVIRGEAEILWPRLCHQWLTTGSIPPRPEPEPPALDTLVFPDLEFTDTDLLNRNIHLEASRGCPLSCAFCLSAVEHGVRHFPIQTVTSALDRLLARGCRQFRFVDRSFNLGGKHALELVDFLLSRMCTELRVHFEMTPDGISQALRQRLMQFPPGCLHIETGIQSFDSTVLATVNRHCNMDAVADGIQWLVQMARADVHADLIAGLPGETLEGFMAGFDRLYRLGPSEIQVGILKRLHGTPLQGQAETWGLRFRNEPPYTVEATPTLSSATLTDIQRFAAHWDRTVNRGHFPKTMNVMLRDAPSPWQRFEAFSRQLASHHGLYGTGLVDMAAELLAFLTTQLQIDGETARAALRQDYLDGGRRQHLPAFLRD
jgi:radical SAM superfamily enzyme YgiQ (UPF0313 family)